MEGDRRGVGHMSTGKETGEGTWTKTVIKSAKFQSISPPIFLSASINFLLALGKGGFFSVPVQLNCDRLE